MSEPIYLYDKHGERKPYYSPSEAHAQVIAGLLFVDPPAQPVHTVDADAVYTQSKAQANAKAELLLEQSVELAAARERWLQEDVTRPLTPDDTLFVEPPPPPVDTRRQRELDALLPPIKRIDIPPQGIPGPNDTQDVPVVPTGRARRKGKGDGNVL